MFSTCELKRHSFWWVGLESQSAAISVNITQRYFFRFSCSYSLVLTHTQHKKKLLGFWRWNFFFVLCCYFSLPLALCHGNVFEAARLTRLQKVISKSLLLSVLVARREFYCWKKNRKMRKEFVSLQLQLLWGLLRMGMFVCPAQTVFSKKCQCFKSTT